MRCQICDGKGWVTAAPVTRDGEDSAVDWDSAAIVWCVCAEVVS